MVEMVEIHTVVEMVEIHTVVEMVEIHTVVEMEMLTISQYSLPWFTLQQSH